MVSIINVVTDVGILTLPIRHILLLRLSLTRRIQVCGIFLLGAVVCVFGIVRVAALAQAPEGDPRCKYRSTFNVPSLTLSLDNQVWSGVWSFCEIAIGIVAACIPTLAVLATRSHLSRVSASVIHLVSLTFRRSHGSSSNDTRASRHSVRETRNDENEFAQLSEWSLARGTSGESKKPIHQVNGDASPFAAGSLTERGEGARTSPQIS